MKLILLPGMDGTGKLFQPFINELPGDIDCCIISYPENECLSYMELEAYVLDKLPQDEDFVILAESFSGPIGYLLAKRVLENMKGIIFVATFLESPKKIIVNIARLMPLSILLSIPVPEFIIKQYFLGKNIGHHSIALFKETIKCINRTVLSYRIREISKLSLNLEKIDIKSFYIQARNDKLVSSDNLVSFTNIFDSLKTIIINGPHFILQAKPGECAEFIANELRLIKVNQA